MTEQDLARFMKFVDRSNLHECWIWMGATNSDGYGRFAYQSKNQKAHRLILKWHTEKSGNGLQACHSCDNPKCVNPHHLFWGTSLENAHDCISKGRRHPTKGEENPRAKLSEMDVVVIRNLALSQRKVAAKFNISQRSVRDILSRKNWSHVL